MFISIVNHINVSLLKDVFVNNTNLYIQWDYLSFASHDFEIKFLAISA